MLTFTFSIPTEFGPAFRAAVEEQRNTIGERLTGAHEFDKERALTHASDAFASLGAAVNALVPRPSEDYD